MNNHTDNSFEKLENSKCPMCSNILEHQLPIMHGFSWVNPYVKCSCGFIFIVKVREQTMMGSYESAFEYEKEQAKAANRILYERFHNE